MSGGTLEGYNKYGLEDVQNHVNNLTREYSPEVVAKFKLASKVIKAARIYMEEIDLLISFDNGEKSFLENVKEADVIIKTFTGEQNDQVRD